MCNEDSLEHEFEFRGGEDNRLGDEEVVYVIVEEADRWLESICFPAGKLYHDILNIICELLHNTLEHSDHKMGNLMMISLCIDGRVVVFLRYQENGSFFHEEAVKQRMEARLKISTTKECCGGAGMDIIMSNSAVKSICVDTDSGSIHLLFHPVENV